MVSTDSLTQLAAWLSREAWGWNNTHGCPPCQGSGVLAELSRHEGSPPKASMLLRPPATCLSGTYPLRKGREHNNPNWWFHKGFSLLGIISAWIRKLLANIKLACSETQFQTIFIAASLALLRHSPLRWGQVFLSFSTVLETWHVPPGGWNCFYSSQKLSLTSLWVPFILLLSKTTGHSFTPEWKNFFPPFSAFKKLRLRVHISAAI